jgi:ACS family sodium-dependent inorganic phosphate cotransporter-like MFS transporter 5
MEVMNDNNASSKNSSNLLPSNISREANRFGKRHILVLLGFLGFANVYALRVNLSVALVVMVNSTYTNQNSEVSSHECSPDSSTSEKV